MCIYRSKIEKVFKALSGISASKLYAVWEENLMFHHGLESADYSVYRNTLIHLLGESRSRHAVRFREDAFFHQRLFYIFNWSSAGRISMKEFLSTMASFMSGSLIDRLRFAFQANDVMGNGGLSPAEVVQLVRGFINHGQNINIAEAFFFLFQWGEDVQETHSEKHRGQSKKTGMIRSTSSASLAPSNVGTATAQSSGTDAPASVGRDAASSATPDVQDEKDMTSKGQQQQQQQQQKHSIFVQTLIAKFKYFTEEDLCLAVSSWFGTRAVITCKEFLAIFSNDWEAGEETIPNMLRAYIIEYTSTYNRESIEDDVKRAQSSITKDVHGPGELADEKSEEKLLKEREQEQQDRLEDDEDAQERIPPDPSGNLCDGKEVSVKTNEGDAAVALLIPTSRL